MAELLLWIAAAWLCVGCAVTWLFGRAVDCGSGDAGSNDADPEILLVAADQSVTASIYPEASAAALAETGPSSDTLRQLAFDRSHLHPEGSRRPFLNL